MIESRLLREFIIFAFFGLLAVSAGTGFPESYFNHPAPKGVRALEGIVSTLGTDPFGKTGGAIFFAILGLFVGWLGFRQKPAKFDAPSARTAHGRRRLPMQKANLPPEIDVQNVEHIGWLKTQSNPGNWHTAAMSCIVYLGDKHGFLDWLIEQPALDRGTAGLIFFRGGGADYLKSGTCSSFPIPQTKMASLLSALCLRSETVGFMTSDIGLPLGYEDERKACLEAINNDELSPKVAAPLAIIKSPFQGPEFPGDYSDIGEGLLVTDRFLAETLPHIFGR